MALYIKTANGSNYLKNINTKDEKVEFTSNEDEAFEYSSSWTAEADIDFLKFHFEDDKKVQDLKLYYT